MAKEHNIPFYVAAPLSTIDLSTPDGDHIPIEERDQREVSHLGSSQLTPVGAHIRNPAFDVTPFRYITGIVTAQKHKLIAINNMPDHLHMLAQFGPDFGMRKVIRNWKRYTASHAGVRWQRDFFDHRLRRDESFDEKAAYILQNPVRAGLVRKIDDWPYRLKLR
jgi:REP element-mobilizing transposase RayT